MPSGRHGEFLRAKRERLGWSVEVAARKCQLPTHTIRAIESGAMSVFRDMLAYSRALGLGEMSHGWK